jgi:hypothetical protein
VQNAQGGLMTRLKGKQAIAKAELIGAGMQLQMSIGKMKSDSEIQFHGMLDNKGMVQALQTAHLLTDRQIKRDKQGGTVLRFVRAMTRSMPNEIKWHWIKAHTNRKGPLHNQHNKCDVEAGEVRREETGSMPCFDTWDWPFVIKTMDGVKIEGDPRKQIRIITSRQYWKEDGAQESKAYKNIQDLGEEQKTMLKEEMGKKDGSEAKKEWCNALSEKWGLASEWNSSKVCRICEREGKEGIEEIEHVIEGECDENMRDWKRQQDELLINNIGKVLNRREWDQLGWLKEGDIDQQMEGRFRQIKEREEVRAKDEWVTQYRHNGGWKKWERIPFVKYDEIDEGEVDIEKIDMSHEENEYPKNSDSKVVKKAYWVLHDKTKALPPCVTEALLCKINKMLGVRDELDNDSRAEMIWNIASTVKPREGPVTEGMLSTLAAIDGTGELKVVEADLWSWNKGTKGTTNNVMWEEIGMERDDGLSSSAVRVLWHKIGIQEALDLADAIITTGIETNFRYYEWVIVPKGALSCIGGSEKNNQKPEKEGPMAVVYVAETEGAMFKGKEVKGELWFMGGREVWDELVWGRIKEYPNSMSGLKWMEVVKGEQPEEGENNEESGILQELYHAIGTTYGQCRLGYTTSDDMSIRDTLRLKQLPDMKKCFKKAGIVKPGKKAEAVNKVLRENIWNRKRGFLQSVMLMKKKDEEEDERRREDMHDEESEQAEFQKNVWERTGTIMGKEKLCIPQSKAQPKEMDKAAESNKFTIA